jgi:hypothetical protein
MLSDKLVELAQDAVATASPLDSDAVKFAETPAAVANANL